MRKAITLISGPILAVFFLWLAFKDVEMGALSARIRNASLILLATSMGTVAVHLVLRALRWRTFLAPIRTDLPMIELTSAVAIGYMASLLPGRVGEVLRPALLSRRTAVPFGAALATVGVERVVFDLLAVVILGAVGLLLPTAWTGLKIVQPETLSGLHWGGGIALLAGLAILAMLTVIARRDRQLAQRLNQMAQRRAGHWSGKILIWLGALVPGLASLKSWSGLIRLSLETALIWLVIALGILFGIRACGVELALGGALIMVPILAVGIGIPTPGGTGPYHAAMVYGLTKLFATPEDAAASAALVVHAATWLPVLLLGGLFAMRGGLSAIERSSLDQAAR